MNGLPYYKAYPRDFFDGTVGLDFEVKGAYRLVLDLIYQHGGRLADDPRFIAGHLGCSVKKWNALRAAIIAAGKISVSDGYLGNYRADKELDSLKSYQGKQREKRLGFRKNNDLAETTVKPKHNHTEPDTDRYVETNVSTAAAPVGAAPAAEDEDPVKTLFDAGIRILGECGIDPRAARQMVGRWRKTHPGKDGQILEAIAAARKAGAVDPIPWITTRLGAARPKTTADYMRLAFPDFPQ